MTLTPSNVFGTTARSGILGCAMVVLLGLPPLMAQPVSAGQQVANAVPPEWGVPARDHVGPAPPSPPAMERYGDAFTVGDRLKITIFEQYKTLSGSAERPVLSTLVEHAEITGDYVVQQDGSVFLPLLGAVEVLGMSGPALQEALALRFGQQLGASIAVSVQLIEREPVYVTGAIAQQGTFKYTPGMTVLHALTLSGGATSVGADDWRRVDLSRERERLQKAEEKLKHLLARAALLVAEREGAPAQVSDRLIELMGDVAAKEFVADAVRLRNLERRRASEEAQAHDAIIAMLGDELTILRESLTDAQTAAKEKAQRLSEMEALRTRGATTDLNLQLARTEANTARSVWHDLRAAQARVERNLAQARQEKARAALDAEIAREREITTTREAITEAETTRATIAQLLLGSSDLIASAWRSEGPAAYEIIRRTPQGIARIRADELAAMQPGDILRVSRPVRVQAARSKW